MLVSPYFPIEWSMWLRDHCDACWVGGAAKQKLQPSEKNESWNLEKGSRKWNIEVHNGNWKDGTCRPPYFVLTGV